MQPDPTTPFTDWFEALNAEAGRRGWTRPEQISTSDYWHGHYEAGRTPAEALDEDETYD